MTCESRRWLAGGISRIFDLSFLGFPPAPAQAPENEGQRLMREILRQTAEVERLAQESDQLRASVDLGQADVHRLYRKNRALNQQLQLLTSAYESTFTMGNVDKLLDQNVAER